MMVLEAIANEIGADRVGFRISPGNGYNGMDTSEPWETFGPFLEAADQLGLRPGIGSAGPFREYVRHPVPLAPVVAEQVDRRELRRLRPG